MNTYQRTIIEEETEALASHALLSHPEHKEDVQKPDCYPIQDDTNSCPNPDANP